MNHINYKPPPQALSPVGTCSWLLPMPLPLTPPLRRLQPAEEVKRERGAGGSGVARRWERQGEAGCEAWRGIRMYTRR